MKIFEPIILVFCLFSGSGSSTKLPSNTTSLNRTSLEVSNSGPNHGSPIGGSLSSLVSSNVIATDPGVGEYVMLGLGGKNPASSSTSPTLPIGSTSSIMISPAQQSSPTPKSFVHLNGQSRDSSSLPELNTSTYSSSLTPSSDNSESSSSVLTGAAVFNTSKAPILTKITVTTMQANESESSHGNWSDFNYPFITAVDPEIAPLCGTSFDLSISGVGPAYAESCQSAAEIYRACSSSWMSNPAHYAYYNVSSSTLTETFSCNSTQWAFTATLCDGWPRVFGPTKVFMNTECTSFSPEAITGTGTEAPYPISSPTCSMPLSDCSMLWDKHNSLFSRLVTDCTTESYVYSSCANTNLSAPFCQTPYNASTLFTSSDTTSTTSIPGQCSGDCFIDPFNKEAKLLYWPISTVGGNVCGKSGTTLTETPTIPGKPNTFILQNGTTLTSPTVYFSFDKLYRQDGCGPTHYNVVVPAISSDVRSVRHPRVYGASYSFNVVDLQTTCVTISGTKACYQEVPAVAYEGMPWCYDLDGKASICPTISQDYSPFLSVPYEVLSLDPLWGPNCEAWNIGVWDPPQALTQKAAPAVPAPVTTDMVTPMSSASPASSPDMPFGPGTSTQGLQPAPTSAPASPNPSFDPASNGDPTQGDPQPASTSLLAQPIPSPESALSIDPVPSNDPPSSNDPAASNDPTQGRSPGGDPSKAPAPNPASIGDTILPPLLGSSSPAAVKPSKSVPDPANIATSILPPLFGSSSPAESASPGSDPDSPTIAGIVPSILESGEATAATPDSVPVSHDPARPLVSLNDNGGPSASSLPGASNTNNGGGDATAAPSAQGSANGVESESGLSLVEASAASPSPIATINGQKILPASSPGAVIVGSSAYTKGQVLTVGNTPISIGSDNVAVGSSTFEISSGTPQASGLATATDEGQGATTGNIPVSVGSGSIAAGYSTAAIPNAGSLAPQSGQRNLKAIITINGRTYTASSGDSVLNLGSTTVSANEAGATLAGGQVVSLAPEGVVIDGTTEFFDPESPEATSARAEGPGFSDAGAIFTVAGQIVTASILSQHGPSIIEIGSNSVLLTNGHAVTMTLNGQKITMNSNGIAIGGTALSFSTFGSAISSDIPSIVTEALIALDTGPLATFATAFLEATTTGPNGTPTSEVVVEDSGTTFTLPANGMSTIIGGETLAWAPNGISVGDNANSPSVAEWETTNAGASLDGDKPTTRPANGDPTGSYSLSTGTATATTSSRSAATGIRSREISGLITLLTGMYCFGLLLL